MTLAGTQRLRAIDSAEAGAAERFAQLRSGLASDRDHAEAAAWRAADPAHEAAWSRLTAIWESSAAAADEPEILALRAAARARISAQPAPASTRWRPYALAAGVAALLGCAIWFTGGGGLSRFDGGTAERVAWSPETRTRVGQIATLRPGDGSVITVNTDSALATAMTASARRVRLDRGEAYFAVAKNPRAPFTVTARGVSVTALGTAFSVRDTGNAVLVTLDEGRVRVVDGDKPGIELEPGTQLRADANGFQVVKLDTQRATRWVSGTLDFDQTPLDTVVGELNRYATRRIVLGDPGLARLPITGIFPIGKQERFVEMLEASNRARVVRRSDSVIELGQP